MNRNRLPSRRYRKGGRGRFRRQNRFPYMIEYINKNFADEWYNFVGEIEAEFERIVLQYDEDSDEAIALEDAWYEFYESMDSPIGEIRKRLNMIDAPDQWIDGWNYVGSEIQYLHIAAKKIDGMPTEILSLIETNAPDFADEAFDFAGWSEEEIQEQEEQIGWL